mgnify:FL=1
MELHVHQRDIVEYEELCNGNWNWDGLEPDVTR